MTPQFLKPYLSPRVWPLLILSFGSGLPLALTSSTLQAWATTAGVNIKSIGLLSFVGAAYSLKFVWAPFLDRFVPPLLGRRRGWMVLAQLALAFCLCVIGFFDISSQLPWVAALAALIAFLSATQDIAYDAYSTDLLPPQERAAGVAVKNLGYRLGMLVSGALALSVLQSWLGWGGTYQFMGLLMLGVCFFTFLAPKEPEHIRPPQTLKETIVEPFVDFITRPRALALLALVILYKLGDAFGSAMVTTFLVGGQDYNGMGYDVAIVGWVNKVLGVIATILGAFIAGSLMSRLGLYRSMLYFGGLQALSNLGYWLIAISPKSIPLLCLAVGIENICGGMGMAALVAFIMALCNEKFTATQYALLSSIDTIGRIFLAGPLTPYIVLSVGWANFFLFTVLFAVPGIFLVWYNRSYIRTLS